MMRDIEEIKRDLSHGENDVGWWQAICLHQTACDLLAEVERLRQQLADAKGVIEQWRGMYIDTREALSQLQDQQVQVAAQAKLYKALATQVERERDEARAAYTERIEQWRRCVKASSEKWYAVDGGEDDV